MALRSVRHYPGFLGITLLCHSGAHISEVPGDAALFPITETHWIGTVATANLLRDGCGLRRMLAASLLGFGQGPLSCG